MEPPEKNLEPPESRPTKIMVGRVRHNTLSISHLQNLAEKLSVALNGMQFETNVHRLRLSDIISMLKSVHKELQDNNVFLCLEKEVEKRLKCGLHRIEFLVNEIKASDPLETLMEHVAETIILQGYIP